MRVLGKCVWLQGHAERTMTCGIASGARKCHSERIAYNMHMVLLLDIFCMAPCGIESPLASHNYYLKHTAK